MHPAVDQWFSHVKGLFPAFFNAVDVLEVGAYDVNGTIRKHFGGGSRFTGVDLVPGPCVDVVCDGADLDLGRYFDVVVSTECFEHNPRFIETFARMIDHTMPGGLVIFTCATGNRQEHGTARTSPRDAPGSSAKWPDYYRNVFEADFPVEMFDRFTRHAFDVAGDDLRFWGRVA